ncbi:hypothetical protein ABZ916_25575 [Streptomyces sp. NPDC046853]|uniref:hypothetical protein n=1 Tax=Streptomyces sp. NPDC046853 TaxID=3154920 RepID=UPI0033D0AEFA
MLTTLKTYANKDTGVSVIISYADNGNGATVSLFAGKQSATVDLDSTDLKALSSLLYDASYSSTTL